jgi:diguanylate cyclase (GGDEF)-like protein/PAS domain S-box-containing protein
LRPWREFSEDARLPVWLIWSLVITTAALLLALGFSLLLRLKVNEKTRSLVASENRLNTILNSVEAYIYIKDHKLRYQYANRKVCELFGLPAEEIIGKTDAAFFDEATCEHLYENDMRVLREGERVADEESNIMASDQQKHEFISVKLPLRNPDGSIYALCGISTDVTEHKQIRNQLHQLAFFDALTGLPNRRLILDRLDHAMASRQKTGYEGALLLIDLDHFKTVNDTLGHEMGDLLLQQVAKRLERGLLTTDSAGRLGADEFVLIVEDVALNANDALVRVRDMAEFLRNQLAQPFDLRGNEYVCSVSVGVAMFSDAGGDTDALLKGADLALAAAKTAGRNMVRFFNPDMQVEVTRRTRIENALRKAIDGNYLTLHLQPQVDEHGATVSLEALLRMTDPALGEVSPGDFIPVAETSGLIVPGRVGN